MEKCSAWEAEIEGGGKCLVIKAERERRPSMAGTHSDITLEPLAGLWSTAIAPTNRCV
jgi:hypothetical protein